MTWNLSFSWYTSSTIPQESNNYFQELEALKNQLKSEIDKLPWALRTQVNKGIWLLEQAFEIQIPIYDTFSKDDKVAMQKVGQEYPKLTQYIIRALQERLGANFSVNPEIQSWNMVEIAYIPMFDLETKTFPVGAHTYGWPYWVASETARQKAEAKNSPVKIIEGLSSRVAWFASKLMH